MRQKITGFHLDREGHWVADLECGHRQHMRHEPPWMVRPWVLTEEGRRSRLGVELDCKRCDEAGREVAEAVREALRAAALTAYEEGGLEDAEARTPTAELSYWLGRAYWGQGLATEAAVALVRYGFETLGLASLRANCFSRNPSSRRVLEDEDLEFFILERGSP
ncbi:GNAT family N-acetyltransferase [Pyxidicoccus xibeiensis]|uniref:GNAT family N-acetyltransferase n=1 Tax=Pyxidicoccus xibeiensis TaxID=2906759 RepID=UPI0020A7493D|nr:GNAT family N-acetyltransferase [Pyxidicoccus xibeiensis]MCP3138115.1 GNAT family N-acetyltransferase [Pyxidicoccus xibeiensis]